MSSGIYNKQFHLEKYSWYKFIIYLDNKIENKGLIKIFEQNNVLQLIPTIKVPNKLFTTSDGLAIYIRTLSDPIINFYALSINILNIVINKSSFVEAKNNINLVQYQNMGDMEFTLFYLNIFEKEKNFHSEKLLDKFNLLKDENAFEKLKNQINLNSKVFNKNDNNTILVLLDNTIQYENDTCAIFWHDICNLLSENYDHKFIIAGKYGYPYDKNSKIYLKKSPTKIENINYAKIYNTSNIKDIYQENILSEYIIKYTNNLIDICNKNGIKMIIANGLINGIVAYFIKQVLNIPYVYENSDNNIEDGDAGAFISKFNSKVYEECITSICRTQININNNDLYIPYSINKNWISDPFIIKNEKIKLGYIGFDTKDNIDNILNILKSLIKVNYSLTVILEENIINKQLDNYKKQGNIIINICKNINDLPKICKGLDAFIFMPNFNPYNVRNVMGLKRPIITPNNILIQNHKLLTFDNIKELPVLIKNINEKIKIDPNAFIIDINTHEEVLSIYNGIME